eukprot:2906953-Prymnesium_polylepis.1
MALGAAHRGERGGGQSAMAVCDRRAAARAHRIDTALRLLLVLEEGRRPHVGRRLVEREVGPVLLDRLALELRN